MSYQATVNVIREVAKSVNADGTFMHGRRSDASLEYDGAFPQIHLLPFTGDVSIDTVYSEQYTCSILFLQQDAPDSSPEQREEIIAEMDELCRSFVLQLQDTDGVEVSNIRTEPNYRVLSATTSGYILSLRLRTTTSPC